MQSTSVIRFWAGCDLIITGLLLIPPTAKWFITLLYQINGWLGMTAQPPVFEPLHWLFVCFAGGLGVLWAAVRLLRPAIFLGRADALGRTWMAGLLTWFVFVENVPMVLLAFIASELLGAVHQGWILKKP